MLSSENIRKYLKTENIELYCFDSIDSTSTKARELINTGNMSNLVVVANEQTGGRGRNGKAFFSPPGVSVYMSVVLHPECKLDHAVGITTSCSVAVSRAIEKITGKKTQIKWVNDLYHNNRKVCGILCEAVAKNSVVSSVIVGVGINLCKNTFPDELNEIAGTLNCDLSCRDFLIAAVADELFNLDFGEISEDILKEYRAKSLVIGKQIIYYLNGKKNIATAVGIDSCGGLVVEKDDGVVETLRSGEITVRLSE